MIALAGENPVAGSRSRGEIILKTFALLLAVCLAYFAIDQARLQWLFRMRFPYWDMVAIVSLLDRNPSPGILELYHTVRDNEHRPIVTFLFYLWDRNYFNDSGELLYRVIFVANGLLVFSLLAILLPIRHTIDLAYRLLLGAIVAFTFFAIYHYQNLSWQKQVHEITCILFLSVGLFFASMVSTRDDVERGIAADVTVAALAGVFCLAASYSFGFGIVAWPVVLLHALLKRWRLWPLIVFAIFAAFTVISYAKTYIVLEHHTTPVQAVSSPFGMLLYAFHVIGTQTYYIFEGFSAKVANRISSLVGLIGVMIGAISIFIIYFGRQPEHSSRQLRVVSFHATMLLIASIGMSVLLSLGRLTINQGLDSRYAIVGSLFWVSLFVLLVSILRPRQAGFCILLFGIAALAAAYFPARHQEELIRLREQDLYQAGVMATDRLQLWPSMPALYPDQSPLLDVWHAPRKGGSFAERIPFRWIGTEIRNLPPAPDTSRCLSSIDAVTKLSEDPSVTKVLGWAFIASQDTHLEWIVITDENSRGLGVGRAGLLRPDVRKYFQSAGVIENPGDQRSSGFNIAIVGEPNQSFHLWGLDSEGRACRLESLEKAVNIN